MRDAVIIAVVASGCGRIQFDDRTDAGGDTTCPFGTPAKIPGVDTAMSEFSPTLTADGLEIYFHGQRPGGLGGDDIYVATRTDVASAFGQATLLENVNSSFNEVGASISGDGLTLYFSSDRPGGVGLDDVWVATRTSRAATFDAPTNLAVVSSPMHEYGPSISPDGLSIYVTSDRPGGLGGLDLWVATRPDIGSSFSSPTNVAAVNSSATDEAASITGDGKTIYFDTDRAGGSTDIWSATRADVGSAFGPPAVVSEVDSSASDFGAKISATGAILYFTSDRAIPGDSDLWFATRCTP